MWTNYDRAYLKMRFDRIERALEEGGHKIMATVEELNSAVSDLTVAVDAAVTAIGASHGIDPAELDAAVATIHEQAKKLNDAVHAAGM